MPKVFKRACLLLAVAAMLPVSLQGCSSEAPQSTPSAPASQSSQSAGDTDSSTAPTASAQSGEPSETVGGSVTVGITQDMDSLDPHKAISAGTSEVLFNLFEGLVNPSPDGGVECAVASDYEISPDGLTYTFTLREGVKFHNGETVTAEDVLYSLERCAGAENEGVPLISAFSIVSGVEENDAGQIVVTLSEPRLEFLNSMTAAIIPADSGEEMAANPIGTGPFRFVSYAPQNSVEMERFPDYWGEGAHLDHVTFQIIDPSTMAVGLQSGTLDMAIHVPSEVTAQLEGFNILSDTMKLVQALYINNAVVPFDDLRVRQAMYYAIDTDAINDFVCNGLGVLTGTSMYPAKQQYFMPELAENYRQDVEKAKALLTEAGYPDGFNMTIIVPSEYPQHVNAGLVIADQLKAVGITATVQEVEFESWKTDVYRGRSFQTTVCAIAASDMTAQEMLQRYKSDHSKNFINFQNAEYDQVVNDAIVALDPAEQERLFKRAEEILNEQAASLWIQDLSDLVVTRPELSGVTFYCTYVLDMSTVYFK